MGIEVTKYDLPKIEIGQKVDVTIAGKEYEGEVSKINKVAAANSQGTPVVGAEVHIKNPDEDISWAWRPSLLSIPHLRKMFLQYLLKS